MRGAAVSRGNILMHGLTRQLGERIGSGNFHRFVDGCRPHIQRAPEQERETQDVIDLIGKIGSPRCDDGIGARRPGVGGRNFRIGIGHRKNNRLIGHLLDHIGG